MTGYEMKTLLQLLTLSLHLYVCVCERDLIYCVITFFLPKKLLVLLYMTTDSECAQFGNTLTQYIASRMRGEMEISPS